MLIRAAKASDADHLVRFINMAADDLPLHFWKKTVCMKNCRGEPKVTGRASVLDVTPDNKTAPKVD